MNSVGILINNLGNNQCAYSCIDYINNVDNKRDYTIFFEDISSRIMEPRCATMNVCNIHNFRGNIIFTELNQANIIFNLVLPTNKIFYMRNVEWLLNPNYEFNYNVYNNPEIKVVCRSDSHAEALERYCGKIADAIEPNFNIENML